MFRHCRVILRQTVINTLPSYTSISNVAVGNTILYSEPTNAHNYFTNYHTATCFDTRVILRQPVINTLPSYTSISNAAVGNRILYSEPTNAHNYFTNYHTATCFDTILSSSDSL